MTVEFMWLKIYKPLISLVMVAVDLICAKKKSSMNFLKELVDSINYEHKDKPFFKRSKFNGKIRNGEFKIGHSISRLYEIYDSSFNFKNSIKSELDFISAKTNETASFFVKQKESRVCIQTSEPNKIIKHSIQIGVKKPLNKGSSGHILSSYHDLQIENKETILKQGYSMSFGERDREIASISVPIFRTKKQFLGALTVTGHISNFNKKNCLNFLNILRSSKIKVEKKLDKIQ